MACWGPCRFHRELGLDIYERTNRDAPTDPVLYVQGGPGQKRPIGAGLALRLVGAVRRNHDVVLYDQRGVGQSQPALDCPELDLARVEDAKQGTVLGPHASARGAAAVVQCRDRLVGAGADLAAYTTAESVADLDDIRSALGYERVNLFGFSYGTYLAQATMRAFPQRIRSVVLDSIVPLDAPTQSSPATADADATLQQIFDLCGDDPVCGQAFPHLKDTYLRLVARLERQPARVPLGDSSLGTAVIDATRFGSHVLRQMAIEPGGVPMLIMTVDRGDYLRLSPRIVEFLRTNQSTSEGYLLSVKCKELVDAPYSPSESGGSGLLSRLVWRYSSLADYCQSWPSDPPDTSFASALQSGLPTLVIAGQLDSLTSAARTHQVARTLP